MDHSGSNNNINLLTRVTIISVRISLCIFNLKTMILPHYSVPRFQSEAETVDDLACPILCTV